VHAVTRYTTLAQLDTIFTPLHTFNKSFIILIPMTMSQTLLDTVSSSTITKCVPDSETGTALGLNMATRSIIGILAPTTGGYMYSWFGYSSFGLLGFIFNGVMAVYMSIFGGIPL